MIVKESSNFTNMTILKNIWSFAKELFDEYGKDNAFQKGAALAYYTVFSIAPIIILVVAIAGIFLGKEAVNNEIFTQLDDLIGSEAAAQTQEMVKNSAQAKGNFIATVMGIVTLVFGATAVFNELQNSLNSIWSLKAKPKNSVVGFLLTRVFSFGMIVTIGFVLLVSLVLNSLIVAFSDKLVEHLSLVTTVIVNLINFFVSLALTGVLFGTIYKILPDANVSWRSVIAGGMFTSVLFTIGKYAIGLYLGTSSVGTTFGAAGSVVVLLLWTYYTSQILFIGAEFTYVYAKRRGEPIQPNSHAVRVIRQEVEAKEQLA